MSRSKHSIDNLMRFWPIGKVVNRLGGWPLLGGLLRPCFDGQGNEAIIIPVQETVRGTESVILPFPVLTPLIEQAAARVLLSRCLCRTGENCRTFPQDLGCLFLGEGAGKINPAVGQAATVARALAHVEQAMEVGLVPLVVHSSFDSWLLGIPYRRSLAICFCCDCCCSVRQGLRMGPAIFSDTVIRLPGLSVVVGPNCTACGACLDVCDVGAVSIEDGRASIGESCKGCGRCVSMCPEGAIALQLAENADLPGQLFDQFGRRTSIGQEDAQKVYAHEPQVWERSL